VVRRLLAGGHEVEVLVRSPVARQKIESLGAGALEGDLTRIDTFVGKLRSFEAVIHCAAPLVFWGEWEFYKKNLLDTTLGLVQACSRVGVKRFVQISSESVLQANGPLEGIDEKFPYPPEPNSYYGKAKREIEIYLKSAPFKMETVIVRPPFIWGPQCPALLAIAEKAYKGSFVWVNHGKSPFEAVHVENLAQATVLALEKGVNRQVYFVTDDQPYTVRSFFVPIFSRQNVPIPERSISLKLGNFLARLSEAVWKKFKIKKAPPLSKFDLAFVSMPRRYSIALARSELGYAPQVFKL